MSNDALRYGSAGVDIDASNAAKARIKKLVEPPPVPLAQPLDEPRSEEHTSELQSHHPISYAVFCLDRKSVV